MQKAEEPGQRAESLVLSPWCLVGGKSGEVERLGRGKETKLGRCDVVKLGCVRKLIAKREL